MIPLRMFLYFVYLLLFSGEGFFLHCANNFERLEIDVRIAGDIQGFIELFLRFGSCCVQYLLLCGRSTQQNVAS